VDDTNGDGYQELAVGSFNGNIYLMDGVDGEILWSYSVGDKIFTIRGVPDLTGNGIPDVVAGTQMLGGSGGRCYALEGNDYISSPAVAVDPTGRPATLTISPNPSYGPVDWSFAVARSGRRVSLRLYDPSGRLVRTLFRGTAPVGETLCRWDGRSHRGETLPAGVYLGRLLVDGEILGTGRAIRLR
jgi:hypothetical protein